MARAMRWVRFGYGDAVLKLRGCGEVLPGERGRRTRFGPSAKRHLRRRLEPFRVAPQPLIECTVWVMDHLGLVPHHRRRNESAARSKGVRGTQVGLVQSEMQ